MEIVLDVNMFKKNDSNNYKKIKSNEVCGK